MAKTSGAIQLTAQLPALDSKATRKRVEEELETIRIYRQIGVVRRETKLGTSYTPRYHGATNAVGKPTEEIAVWNVDRETMLENKSEQIERALNRLKKKQRELLTKRYLEVEDAHDYLICHELDMSERHYTRMKARAVYLLALMMNWEVFTE